MSQVFKQCGSDLIALINLELVESLCGFRKAIQTPNNGDVVITTKPGVVTHHGEKKNMLKEGPTCKNPLKKDRLVIQFLVNFPCSVDHGVIPALEYYLPLRPSVFLPDFFERCHLKNLDAEHEKRVWRAYLGPAYDEDDDHPIINLYKNEQGDFKQSGNDLIICLTIELVEALCGFRKVIETVDNRYITFEVMPGRVTKPGKMKYVSNQGLPINKNPSKKGLLIIIFLVNFPRKIHRRIIPAIEKCMPRRPVVDIPEQAEEWHLAELAEDGKLAELTDEDDLAELADKGQPMELGPEDDHDQPSTSRAQPTTN